MPRSTGPLLLALLVITVGVGWLLTALDYVPTVNWVWTLGLAIVGLLAYVISGGVDKVSVILGPFFLAASVMSVMRQTGRLATNVEAPILVILAGVLLAVAWLPAVPLPGWVKDGELKPPKA